MAFEKICPTCEQPFTTRFRNVQHCSVSCASKARVCHTPEQIKAYIVKHTHIPEDQDACWNWYGYITDRGRPIACVLGKRLYASHVVYELFVGPIPEGLYLLHDCDNARCVNWRHLHPGTLRQNNNERTARQRTAHGSQHYAARLVERDIREIFQLYYDYGLSQQAIAKRFNVSFVAIHNIIYRETWKHVFPGQYPPPSDARMSVTADDVRFMRELYDSGTSTDDLGKQFGITPQHAWRICTRRAWAHIA